MPNCQVLVQVGGYTKIVYVNIITRNLPDNLHLWIVYKKKPTTGMNKAM